MNTYKTEFSKLNDFLQECRFDVSESPIRTRLGILNIAEFYFKQSDLKKVEIVADSQPISKGLVLKLENIIPRIQSSNSQIRSFSIQVFNDNYKGLNYGGRITIPQGTYLNNFDQISTNFFDDFKNNSFQIYQKLGDLIYNINPDSLLLDRISLAMTAKFPNQTPNIGIRRI